MFILFCNTWQGGKYYYWEHIRDQEVWWIRWIQHLATFTFYDTVFGCHLNRTSDKLIKDDKTFSSIEQQFFRTPLQRGLWKIHSFHVKGVATKWNCKVAMATDRCVWNQWNKMQSKVKAMFNCRWEKIWLKVSIFDRDDKNHKMVEKWLQFESFIVRNQIKAKVSVKKLLKFACRHLWTACSI